MKALWNKYKEFIIYVFFGTCTTVINLVLFRCGNRWLGEDWYLFSNILAWVGAVIFAFFSNKLWVFGSRSFVPRTVGRELISFVGARLLSLGVEEAGLFLLVDVLGFSGWTVTVPGVVIGGRMVAKILLSCFVVLINYVFSKRVIFRPH